MLPNVCCSSGSYYIFGTLSIVMPELCSGGFRKVGQGQGSAFETYSI